MFIRIQAPAELPKGRGLRVSVGEGWPKRSRPRWDIELAEGATGTIGMFDRGKPMVDHLHPMVVRDGKLFVNGVVVDMTVEKIIADGITVGMPKRARR